MSFIQYDLFEQTLSDVATVHSGNQELIGPEELLTLQLGFQSPYERIKSPVVSESLSLWSYRHRSLECIRLGTLDAVDQAEAVRIRDE